MKEYEYNSPYCHVRYVEKDNVVLLTWKKYCCFVEYRKPTMFAADLLKEFSDSNFVVDARNGFEDAKEDVEWGFNVLLPTMAQSDCKFCIFIMNEVSDIDDEIDLWTKEFMKYFTVKKVLTYAEAIEIIHR